MKKRFLFVQENKNQKPNGYNEKFKNLFTLSFAVDDKIDKKRIFFADISEIFPCFIEKRVGLV